MRDARPDQVSNEAARREARAESGGAYPPIRPIHAPAEANTPSRPVLATRQPQPLAQVVSKRIRRLHRDQHAFQIFRKALF